MTERNQLVRSLAGLYSGNPRHRERLSLWCTALDQGRKGRGLHPQGTFCNGRARGFVLCGHIDHVGVTVLVEMGGGAIWTSGGQEASSKSGDQP